MTMRWTTKSLKKMSAHDVFFNIHKKTHNYYKQQCGLPPTGQGTSQLIRPDKLTIYAT